ncbi:MAG TPA: hypothetical protein VN549_02605, partial [Negativicutes bacterium]|nr:hypothetical protein [Negativicutes bacterium]
NDGIVNIYSVGNTADSGNMPNDVLDIKVRALHYEERVVGMSRFWSAKQANAKVDLIIRTPQLRNVSTQDIAIPIDGEQYKIVQIQYPKDVEPPSMDLSLERVEEKYEIS